MKKALKACVEAMNVARKHGVVPVYAAASLENVQHSFCPVGKDVVIGGNAWITKDVTNEALES